MSEGSEKAEEKVFTPGFIVAVLIYVLANAYLNQTVSWLTTWWLWHQIIPPSIFTSILVLYVLERISGRHLNRKQVMLFLFVMITGQGRGVLSWVLNKPAWNVPQTIGTGSITYALWHLIAPGVSPVTSPYMAKHWYAFPQNPTDISWAWNGLPKGQALPWGDYMVPIIWWTTTMLLSAGLGIFLAQILYKPALEVEKLPYPAITPSATLFDWYWGKEGEEKKIGGKMFSIFENRLFWIFVVIGLLITLPDILVYVIGGFPPGIYYGQYFFSLAPWLSSIFPGGSFYFYLYFYRLAWYIFLSLIHISEPTRPY